MKKVVEKLKIFFLIIEKFVVDFRQKVRDNKQELIRGSILDPDNHPSKK